METGLEEIDTTLNLIIEGENGSCVEEKFETNDCCWIKSLLNKRTELAPNKIPYQKGQ